MSKKPENKQSQQRWRAQRSVSRTNAQQEEEAILDDSTRAALNSDRANVTQVKTRPLLAHERRTQNPHKQTAPAPPTTATAASGVSGTNGVAAQVADTAATSTSGPSAVPDCWDDDDVTEARDVLAKVLSTETAVTNVGAGMFYRKLAPVVHHIDPIVIPSDAVRKVFHPNTPVPAGHTVCEHRLHECDCQKPNTFVFYQSSYYITREDLVALPDDARIILYFNHSTSKRMVMTYENGSCTNFDKKVGAVTFKHPDHRWQLESQLLPDGRTYCVQPVKVNGSTAVLRATIRDLQDHGLRKRVVGTEQPVVVEAEVPKTPAPAEVKQDDDELARCADQIVAQIDPKSNLENYTLKLRCVSTLSRRMKVSFAEALRAVEAAFSRVRAGHFDLAKAARDDLDNRFILGYSYAHSRPSPGHWPWIRRLIALVLLIFAVTGSFNRFRGYLDDCSDELDRYEIVCEGEETSTPWNDDYEQQAWRFERTVYCNNLHKTLWDRALLDETIEKVNLASESLFVWYGLGAILLLIAAYLLYQQLVWARFDSSLRKRRAALNLGQVC